jgi:hypothetical protein
MLYQDAKQQLAGSTRRRRLTGFRLRLGAALRHERFQIALALIAGVPIFLAYLWRTLFSPIVAPGTDPVDFFEDYVATGRLVATGQDPYSECLSRACWKGLTNAWSVYPPVVSWLSQPLWRLDHALIGAGALLVAQVCVVVFVVVTVRALRIRDWRAILILTIAVCSFPPLVDQVVQRNVEVILLAVSGIWFAAWVAGDRWSGGLALGFGVAIKLVQAPLLLLSVWGGRFRTAAAAGATVVVLWAVAAPQYLPEYLLRVVPQLNAGTGYAMDIAPIGTIARLFHPASLFAGQASGIDMKVRLIAMGITLAVGLTTVLAIRSPARDARGRALEAALVVAATPLMVTVVRPGHLLLLLLPMMVVGTVAWRERRPLIGWLLGISWVLMGPAYLWYTNLIAAGFVGFFVRPGEEIAITGAALLWLACVLALVGDRLSQARSHETVPVASAGTVDGIVNGSSLGATVAGGAGRT